MRMIRAGGDRGEASVTWLQFALKCTRSGHKSNGNSNNNAKLPPPKSGKIWQFWGYVDDGWIWRQCRCSAAPRMLSCVLFSGLFRVICIRQQWQHFDTDIPTPIPIQIPIPIPRCPCFGLIKPNIMSVEVECVWIEWPNDVKLIPLISPVPIDGCFYFDCSAGDSPHSLPLPLKCQQISTKFCHHFKCEKPQHQSMYP